MGRVVLFYDKQKSESKIEEDELGLLEEEAKNDEFDDNLSDDYNLSDDFALELNGYEDTFLIKPAGNKAEDEWTKNAKEVLARIMDAHSQKKINEEFIGKARELIKEKKHMRGKLTKSVFERKDLLKLEKNKLAKQCKEYGIPTNGTKRELVSRLLEEKKHLRDKERQKMKKEKQKK